MHELADGPQDADDNLVVRGGCARICGQRRPERSTVKKLAVPLEREAEDAKLTMQVVDYYQTLLQQIPEAMEYLTKRGIASMSRELEVTAVDPVVILLCHLPLDASQRSSFHFAPTLLRMALR